MRRVSLVSLIAAAVVIGHLGYHLVRSCPTQHPGAVAVNLPARPWAAGATAAAPLLETARLLSHSCRLQPPLSEADRAFIERFQRCGVAVREFDDDVLVATASGGDLTGARFRKTPHGWIALATDGRDIR
ncbi:MAG TPA: hypothetical protein VIF57_28930 [Polyangia bacterium]